MIISLINIPVKLYTAVSSSSRVKWNMLHKDFLSPLTQFYKCESHGKVEHSDIVKGYEFEKGRYIEVYEDTKTTKISRSSHIKRLRKPKIIRGQKNCVFTQPLLIVGNLRIIVVGEISSKTDIHHDVLFIC